MVVRVPSRPKTSIAFCAVVVYRIALAGTGKVAAVVVHRTHAHISAGFSQGRFGVERIPAATEKCGQTILIHAYGRCESLLLRPVYDTPYFLLA